MEKNWIIAFSLFVIFTFLFWLLTKDYFKKENGELMWKQWGTQLYFWQGALYTGAGLTFLTMFLLRWANVLNF